MQATRYESGLIYTRKPNNGDRHTNISERTLYSIRLSSEIEQFWEKYNYRYFFNVLAIIRGTKFLEDDACGNNSIIQEFCQHVRKLIKTGCTSVYNKNASLFLYVPKKQKNRNNNINIA